MITLSRRCAVGSIVGEQDLRLALPGRDVPTKKHEIQVALMASTMRWLEIVGLDPRENTIPLHLVQA